MSSSNQEPGGEFWLFGYGSLIFKPPPHFDQQVPGYIEGYVRRFWQASEDHRGTPEAPGRVVTLIERSFWESLDDPQRHSEGDKVWGVAYRIVPEKIKEVQAYLDIREINGYSIRYTDFYPADHPLSSIKCLVYIGMPDNPQFLGAISPADVASKINQSVGPSGQNREYLFRLEEALTSLSPDSGDAHVSDLANRVRAMPSDIPPLQNQRLAATGLNHVTCTGEEEEIEK